MGLSQLAQPFSALCGFALFLVVNATSVWGGVFPFLPAEFQTMGVTVSFFVAQTIASALSFALVVVCSFLAPGVVRRVMPWLGVPCMLAGSCALIAAMYVDVASLAFVVVSGVLLGVGSTCAMLLWQRVIAHRDADHGTMLVIAGTGLSAVMYFVLCLCPLSVTAFLVPLVFLPLCGTSLALALRAELSDGMGARSSGPGGQTAGEVEDDPAGQRRVYAGVIKDYWRSALAVGALGFVAGVIRAVALGSEEVGNVVNVTSMFGALVSSAILVILWRMTSFRFSPTRAFGAIFPLLICAMGLLPFLTLSYLDVFAGFVHMLFAFAQMILIVQCAQASRDRGADPVIVFGLCGGIATVMQCLGLICGWETGAVQSAGQGIGRLETALTAILCMWALGIAYYLCQRKGTGHPVPADSIEFISLSPDPRATAALASQARGAGEDASVGGARHVLDRISKQCESLRLHYRLSSREAEVMERIVRGDTVPRIAGDLDISENTVRTHAKRIYTKLGVHSKQELSDLLAQFSPANMDG